jgi:ankyrin repeat protein
MFLGRFRWTYCQLDMLSRSFLPSIRTALDELPITLDETYERTLQGIAIEKQEHAHRLFQCLIAAVRPLRVDELAEILAIKFTSNANAVPGLVEGWRPENPQEALLSACSTLITIVGDEGSKIVQFSHFSVREFLTSDRLRTSRVANLRCYYVPLDVAHITLGQVCFAMLLPLDDGMDKRHLETLPLASYSARYWVDHAKFKNTATQFEDAMERLFDPKKPYFKAWTQIYNIDDGDGPSRATPLYYAVLCGFTGLAKHLIMSRGEDVNARCGHHRTPLHAASYRGHLDTVRLLLDHGANVNPKIEGKRSPLYSAFDGGHVDVMQLLLEHEADVDVICSIDGSARLSHIAARLGNVEVLELLLSHKADVNARDSGNATPLYYASARGHTDVVQLLLQHGANVDLQTAKLDTALRIASFRGHIETVRVLLGHRASVHIRNKLNLTAIDYARRSGHDDVVQLLLDHGADRK